MEAAQKAGCTNQLVRAVHARLDAEALTRERRIPLAPGRVRRSEQPTQEQCTFLPVEAVEAGEPSPRQVGPRHVEWTAHRLSPPDRDDACTGGQRVSPLGRRGEPRADDTDALGIFVRLVRVHGAWVVAQLLGHRQPGMAVGKQYVL